MKQVKLVVVLSLIILAITLSGAPQTPAAETLRIGCIGSLSGGAAYWGIGELRAMELMAEKINAAGGIQVGGKKYLIELVVADCKSNVDAALSEANRLVFKENVKYIMGSDISATTLAFLPLTNRNKVVVITYSHSPACLGPDKPYSFRLYPGGRENTSALINYLSRKKSNIAVALIGPNDQSAWDMAKMAEELAKDVGVKIVFKDFVQRGATDYFPLITKMLPTKPDVVVILTMPEGMSALLVQQSHQLGYKGFFASNSSYDIKAVVERAGIEAVEGMINVFMDESDPKAPREMRAVYDRYLEKYKEKFNNTTTWHYPEIAILKMAIEKAGTLDTTAVGKTLEDIEGEYPYGGPFSMGGMKTYGAKHQIIGPVFMSEVKQGKCVYISTVYPSVP